MNVERINFFKFRLFLGSDELLFVEKYQKVETFVQLNVETCRIYV